MMLCCFPKKKNLSNISIENRCFFLPIDWGGLLEAGYLCKLLSGEIFKAFLSIVHLPKLFFKDTSVESVAPFFRICWNILECFRIRRGSWYQHSVEACLTIRLCWPKDFDRLKFPTFLPPFKHGVGWEEVWNRYSDEDAETFGDRIRLGSILRNINQRIFRDFCRDAFRDTHTSRLVAARWPTWSNLVCKKRRNVKSKNIEYP